jgi:hypothetical protein
MGGHGLNLGHLLVRLSGSLCQFTDYPVMDQAPAQDTVEWQSPIWDSHHPDSDPLYGQSNHLF